MSLVAREASNAVNRFSRPTAEAIAFSEYSIGSEKERMRKRKRICAALYAWRAPLMVMKFLSDFDILRPSICVKGEGGWGWG